MDKQWLEYPKNKPSKSESYLCRYEVLFNNQYEYYYGVVNWLKERDWFDGGKRVTHYQPIKKVKETDHGKG